MQSRKNRAARATLYHELATKESPATAN